MAFKTTSTVFLLFLFKLMLTSVILQCQVTWFLSLVSTVNVGKAINGHSLQSILLCTSVIFEKKKKKHLVQLKQLLWACCPTELYRTNTCYSCIHFPNCKQFISEGSHQPTEGFISWRNVRSISYFLLMYNCSGANVFSPVAVVFPGTRSAGVWAVGALAVCRRHISHPGVTAAWHRICYQSLPPVSPKLCFAINPQRADMWVHTVVHRHCFVGDKEEASDLLKN